LTALLSQNAEGDVLLTIVPENGQFKFSYSERDYSEVVSANLKTGAATSEWIHVTGGGFAKRPDGHVLMYGFERVLGENSRRRDIAWVRDLTEKKDLTEKEFPHAGYMLGLSSDLREVVVFNNDGSKGNLQTLSVAAPHTIQDVTGSERLAQARPRLFSWQGKTWFVAIRQLGQKIQEGAEILIGPIDGSSAPVARPLEGADEDIGYFELEMAETVHGPMAVIAERGPRQMNEVKRIFAFDVEQDTVLSLFPPAGMLDSSSHFDGVYATPDGSVFAQFNLDGKKKPVLVQIYGAVD
jgi:hypothetical protein